MKISNRTNSKRNIETKPQRYQRLRRESIFIEQRINEKREELRHPMFTYTVGEVRELMKLVYKEMKQEFHRLEEISTEMETLADELGYSAMVAEICEEMPPNLEIEERFMWVDQYKAGKEWFY